MHDEPSGLVQWFWKASLTVLGATFALWLSVQILLRIWWVLVIGAVAVTSVAALIRWWRLRDW